jgi:hypothetical protein
MDIEECYDGWDHTYYAKGNHDDTEFLAEINRQYEPVTPLTGEVSHGWLRVVYDFYEQRNVVIRARPGRGAFEATWLGDFY